MLYALALLGAVAPFVSATPQVTAAISPSQPAPSGCSYTYSGEFDLAKAVNAKRGLNKRQATGNAVQLSLTNGVMQDPTGYTAYIASNYQFQFDKPPQAGAIYTAGFSICPNMTIALGGTAQFYQCTNGSGKFNIYFQETTGLMCSPIFLEAVPISGSGAVTSVAPSAIPSYTPPASTPASPSASSPASPPASSAPGTVVPPPVPSGGTGSPAPPVSSTPSTPTPPPVNMGAMATFAPEMIALAIGAVGAALL